MSSKDKAVAAEKASVFARIALFIRQIFAELKKVVWPTREELVTYFQVVIVFVLAMAVFTGVVDFAFAWLVNKVFGG